MSRNVIATIATANAHGFTSGGYPIMYRTLESALIQADMIWFDAKAQLPKLGTRVGKAAKVREITSEVMREKARLDRKWSREFRGYDDVTLENLEQMAGAATYMAVRAKARGRFWKKHSFLDRIEVDGTQVYSAHEFYEERVKVTDPETGERHFLKDENGEDVRITVRETDQYQTGSKYADNILRSRFQSQHGTGRAPQLFVRDGIKNADLTIANDYDDLYQDAVLAMLEHLHENKGVDDGETFTTGGKAVGNVLKKQYTRSSTQQLVNTDENGERLPDGQFRKIRIMNASIDATVPDKGDSFWVDINGTLEATNRGGVHDGGINDVATVDWMMGFIRFADERLTSRQRACFRILIDKRNQLTKVKSKNGSYREVLGATLDDINHAVYNGKATEHAVKKIKRDTRNALKKLREAYNGVDATEGKKPRKSPATEVPTWYKGNPVDTTHGTELHKLHK